MQITKLPFVFCKKNLDIDLSFVREVSGDSCHYKKNNPIHEGLLLSQSSKNVSPLTHDDDAVKRHVSRVIHLLDQNTSSQVGFSIRHG